MSGNQRVLVADDDPQLLAAVAEAFGRGNCDVVRAENGAEFVEQLTNQGPFDLIVADVAMPWMDGLKAMSSMRTAGLATPVIVMTALREKRYRSGAALSRRFFCANRSTLEELDAAVAKLMSPSSATPPPLNTTH